MKIRSHFIKPYQNCTVFTVSLEKSDLHRSFLAIPDMASVVFFIQHILVAVERFLEGAHEKLIKSQARLSS